MANANPAQRHQEVAVKLYKIQQLPHGCTARTHYSWTLKQADRAGAIQLNEAGMVTAILEKNLKFDLPKGMEMEDVMSAEMLKDFMAVDASKGASE